MEPAPKLPDGEEPGDDELDIDFIPDQPAQFYWTKDPDEIRRFYIFDKLADPSIAGHILVENMELIFKWCTKGVVPRTGKSHLKVAES